MSLDPADFKAPFIPPEKCWSAADEFRRRFVPDGQIPVDVLEIAEIDLELEVRTVGDLKRDADVDALLLGNWTTMLVDRQQYMDTRYTARLRFSIAHELGHYCLHQQVFQQIPRETPREWIAFMQGMPDKQYGFLEFQAYEFAGRLLVPRESLELEFAEVIAEVERQGIRRSQVTEGHLPYFCIPLSKAFAVSQDVIEKRLNREKLWPLT